MSRDQHRKAGRVFYLADSALDDAQLHKLILAIDAQFNVTFDSKALSWSQAEVAWDESIGQIKQEHCTVDGNMRIVALPHHGSGAVAKVTFQPPPLAEFLIGLCARTKSQKAALGDLDEIFKRNCAQLGRQRASRLYWSEALQSLLPLLWRTVGRLAKWAVIFDAIKRHFFSP